MIGLGTMGRNLLLNMADNGFSVAGYDKDNKQLDLLNQEGKGKNVRAFDTLEEFVSSLETPRVVVLLVPAGKIVDAVIEELVEVLEKGDIIIDSGNSFYKDTDKRGAALSLKGLHFFGMGISGGEEGARKGPSIMPGGDKEAYQYMKPVLEAISAKFNNEPCVTYIGPGSAGHFVKMVHNGIEYGQMQLLADTYAILKDVLKLSNQQIGETFSKWNDGPLRSYLLEISAEIMGYRDEASDDFLVDRIKDEARSKGTGKWTSQVAMDLGIPIPTIDVAVAMRDLSRYKQLRTALGEKYSRKIEADIKDQESFIEHLHNALYFGMISLYAQGLHMLFQASLDYKYELNLKEIAAIWRAGCIIRSSFLDNITQAYAKNASLEHLFLDPGVVALQNTLTPSLPVVLQETMLKGLSVPAFASAWNYYLAATTGRLSSNLIQAQRDFFGAHTYERTDKDGLFHTNWNNIPSTKTDTQK